MTNIVLEQVKADKARGHEEEELEILREKAVKALQSVPCYFSRLPVELQMEIFSVVIDGSNTRCSNARTLTLTHVCRSWRDAIVGTPHFWRSLTVAPKKGPEKADAWFQRSGGILTDLHIVGEFSSDDRSRMFKDAASTIWSNLDTLAIIARSVDNDVLSVLPPTAVDGLRLRKFVVCSKKLNDESLRALTNVDGSRMRHFALTTFGMEIRLADLNFTSLTTLMLCIPVSFWDLSLLLKKNPLLENLVLESFLASISPERGVEDLQLDHLVRLELINSATRHCLEQVRFPNLKTLVVRDKSVYGIPALIDGQKLAALKHLTLSILVSEDHIPVLVSVLHRATTLKTLEISNCFFDAGGVNTVVEALADESMCPKLQHIDLSGHRYLKAGPVIRLVEAHLSRPANATSSDGQHANGPLPILSLNLYDCPQIGLNKLAWLRTVVPQISRRMAWRSECNPDNLIETFGLDAIL